MKVLHISKFFPPVMGGIESVTWELAEGLNRAGLQTDVLCAHTGVRTLREQAAPGYQVTRAGAWGRWLSTSLAPALVFELRRLQDRYDLIHVHMPDPMAALALWLCRPRAKLVVHWHSDVIRQRRALKVYGPLQDWLLQRADAIVATSETYADASAPLARWRHKVSVVPIGISDDSLSADPAEVAAIRQRLRQRRLVFALGRMTYYKGFDVLIDAAAALPRDTVVMIGGEGPLLDPLRKLVAQRGLAGKVHLPGHIDDRVLASHFQASELFCMPSTERAEAFGVAMVEAMIMGKPVVASHIEGSGVPWVNRHGQTGYNVPVRDAVALADAMNRLLTDEPLRQRMGRAARQHYLAEFSAERMTERMLALYRQLHKP